MAQTRTIKNVTGAEQYIIKDGVRYTLGPHELRVLEEPLANLFVEMCAPRVVFEQAVNAVDFDTPLSEQMWIYNNTGNPDAPDVLSVQRVVKRQQTMIEVPNPNKHPQLLKRPHGGGQKIVTRGNFTESLNFPSRLVVLNPYTRKAFPKDIAQWFLLRDMRQEDTRRGAAKLSRPPTFFEPNETWDYTDLRIYAGIIDSSIPFSPEYEVMIKRHSRKGVDGETTKAFKEEFEKQKDLLIKRLFFRIADPKFRLPTQEEFNEVKAEYLERKKKAPKIPGRPPADRPPMDVVETA